jgi:hypothetical protein
LFYRQLFDNENGRINAGLALKKNPNGFLAKAKAQTAKRFTKNTSAEREQVDQRK